MSDADMRADSSRKELAAIFGVSDASVTRYVRSQSFPLENKRGRYDTLLCVRWWLLNKAPRDLRCIPKYQAEELEEEENLEEQDKLLDLRLKSHKVSQATAEVVPPEELRHIIGEFITGIREICQDAEPEMQERIETVHDRFMESLALEQERLTAIS